MRSSRSMRHRPTCTRRCAARTGIGRPRPPRKRRRPRTIPIRARPMRRCRVCAASPPRRPRCSGRSFLRCRRSSYSSGHPRSPAIRKRRSSRRRRARAASRSPPMPQRPRRRSRSPPNRSPVKPRPRRRRCRRHRSARRAPRRLPAICSIRRRRFLPTRWRCRPMKAWPCRRWRPRSRSR